MTTIDASASSRSKKVLVNPLIAGNNIHYNKTKYTVASSHFGVKESSASQSVDKVHYNPRFFVQNTTKLENVHINPHYLSNNRLQTVSHTVGTAVHVNPQFLSLATSNFQIPRTTFTVSAYPQNVNKYKYVRKEGVENSGPKTTVATQRSVNWAGSSKYKVVNTAAPSIAPKLNSKTTSQPGIMIKSKYSIRTCQPNSVAAFPAFSRPIKNPLDRDFKRISRTKLVRKTLTCSPKLKKKWKIHPKSNYDRLKFSRSKKLSYKISRNLNRASSDCGSFKSYSRTKLVRKSVLRCQIDARKSTRKFTNYSAFAINRSQPPIKSKYKFVRTDSCLSQKKTASQPSSNKASNAVRIKKRKSLIATMTAKLRKNNQRCLFYNRFGRCKGKDRGTCSKIHDPLYVSVCKKLPFGECTDKNCLLSHDTRPGKMPTCYHYLAGICKRDNCPYLHIKVNRRAPICQLFLHGFCPDVYNCLKRHEYICPAYAEKGTCPKGKSCAHPHKIPTVHSKLLTDHQRPLMVNPALPQTTKPNGDKSGGSSSPSTTKESSPFVRYFTVPLTSKSDSDTVDNTVR